MRLQKGAFCLHSFVDVATKVQRILTPLFLSGPKEDTRDEHHNPPPSSRAPARRRRDVISDRSSGASCVPARGRRAEVCPPAPSTLNAESLGQMLTNMGFEPEKSGEKRYRFTVSRDGYNLRVRCAIPWIGSWL
jgi:hypothetical protein